MNSSLSTTPSTAPAINRDKLRERCLGIEAFADKIATAFVASLPGERSSLRHAVDTSDWSEVARRAHRLCGSASNVCADELSVIAKSLEHSVKTNAIDESCSLIDRIEETVDRILREFGDSPEPS